MEILLMLSLIWGSMLVSAPEFVCSEWIPQSPELEIWKRSFMENSHRVPLNHGYIGQSYQTGTTLKFNCDVQKKTVEANSEESLENSGSIVLPMEKNFQAGPI